MKLRLFLKPILSGTGNSAMGKIEIRNGSFDFCMGLIKANKDKIHKAILEVK